MRKENSTDDENKDIYYLVETSVSNTLQAYKTKLLHRLTLIAIQKDRVVF